MNLAFPSIDLLEGKAVRLKQGRKDTAEVLGDPVQLAKKYDSLGFELLHVVDLDAAFGSKNQFRILMRIAAACKRIKIQWGGGIRNADLAAQALEVGASRVIFSTALFMSNLEVEKTSDKFGAEAVVAGLDFRGGIAQVKGWKQGTGANVSQAVKAAENCGAGSIVATSVEADGMQNGPDLDLVEKVRNATKLPVIAAGGVRNAADAIACANAGANGVIFGRALYGKEFDLEELACLQKE